MQHIQVLDQVTIDKIAAGEVIERPASIVKELVENAIDAGATHVTIEIEEGGISLIRITDDGSGIMKEDIRNAFLRHSTSKIRNVEDLLHITSLGFRGEALSSIAAVTKVEVITKTKEAILGTRYVIEGGQELSLDEAGSSDGTTFIIRQLFYNVPARRKFLKTAMTEAGHVQDLLIRLALSHPEVAFRFLNNNQEKLRTSGSGKLKDVIYNIYGRDVASNLLELDYRQGGIHITGYLGKPLITRGNRNFETFFVNGRYVKSTMISRAVEDAYKDFMMQHKFPFVVLHFQVDTETVDVNVHPTKMELRFNNQQEVYNTIYAAIEQGLHEKQLIPHVEMPEPKAAPVRMEQKVKKPVISPPQERNLDYFMGKMKERVMAEYEERKASKDSLQKNQESLQNQASDMQQNTAESKKDALQNVKRESQYISKNAEQAGMYNVVREEKNVYMAEKQLSSPEEANVVPEESSVIPEKSQEQNKQNVQQEYTDIAKNAKQMELFEDNLLTREAMQKYKVVGQVFETYWLVEYGNNLYIIDQHAAHERVLYEKTLKSMKTREFTSQMISPPIVLTLGMQEAELLETYMDQFTRIGFEIEEFGQDSYAVRAVPDNLFSIAKKDLLMEMIDSLSDEITRNLSLDLIDEKIASMSCKAAVKGNMKLSIQEVDALIGELLSLDNPYHCPHGRPTIIAMTKRELEKKFKRIV